MGALADARRRAHALARTPAAGEYAEGTRAAATALLGVMEQGGAPDSADAAAQVLAAHHGPYHAGPGWVCPAEGCAWAYRDPAGLWPNGVPARNLRATAYRRHQATLIHALY